MAVGTKTFPISGVIGITADREPLARELARAITRTVVPDSWFARGGAGSAQPVFNGKDWFLIVYTEDGSVLDGVQAVLDAMKQPV